MLEGLLLWDLRLQAAELVVGVDRVHQVVREVGVVKVERAAVLMVVEIVRVVKVVIVSVAVPVVRETRKDLSPARNLLGPQAHVFFFLPFLQVAGRRLCP
jgi:hypothetical protein